MNTILHRDGTLSYWSVLKQSYLERTIRITATELGTFGAEERKRVLAHLKKHGWEQTRYSWHKKAFPYN